MTEINGSQLSAKDMRGEVLLLASNLVEEYAFELLVPQVLSIKDVEKLKKSIDGLIYILRKHGNWAVAEEER